jgi:hypothetical protein
LLKVDRSSNLETFQIFSSPSEDRNTDVIEVFLRQSQSSSEPPSQVVSRCVNFPTLTTSNPHRGQESIEAAIDLPDDDPVTIHRMLNFIYTGEYNLKLPRKDHDLARLEGNASSEATHNVSPQKAYEDLEIAYKAHAMLYCCADKYGIPSLRDLAFTYFVQASEQKAFYLDGEFLELVFENTPRDDPGLRASVLGVCVEQHEKVKANRQLVDLLTKHEPITWEIGTNVQKSRVAAEAALHKLTGDHAALLGQQQTLQHNLDTVKSQAQQDSDKYKRDAAATLKKVTDEAKVAVQAAKLETQASKAGTEYEIAYMGQLIGYLWKGKPCKSCGAFNA